MLFRSGNYSPHSRRVHWLDVIRNSSLPLGLLYCVLLGHNRLSMALDYSSFYWYSALSGPTTGLFCLDKNKKQASWSRPTWIADSLTGKDYVDEKKKPKLGG